MNKEKAKEIFEKSLDGRGREKIIEAIGIYKADEAYGENYRVFHRFGEEDRMFKKRTPALLYARKLAKEYGLKVDRMSDGIGN